MSYEQGIESAARAILRRHRKTGGYRDEARAAVEAFLSAQPTLWRCWDNVVLGERNEWDWQPHLSRPHYCKPENGHKDCGEVRIVERETP